MLALIRSIHFFQSPDFRSSNFNSLCLAVLLLLFTPQLCAQTTPAVADFELKDIQGNLVSLAQQRGKIVMINFWATWCAPCVEEMPDLNALKTTLADKPFEILAINIAEDIESIEKFLHTNQFQPEFPLLLDPGGVVSDQYAVRDLPATMLVDKTGQFIFGGVGARKWNSPEVLQEILPLFDG